MIDVLIWGVTIGCIYVLLAAGLNLIFGVMKLVNFAHGELLMIGAYICYWASNLLHLNPYIAVFASMAVVPLVGIAVERFCFRPVLGTTKLNEIFVSLGLIYIIEHATILLWKDDPRRTKSPFEKMTVPLGNVSIRYDLIIAMMVVIGILVAFFVLLKKTKVGRAMRATSQSREAAMLMGIDINRIYTVSFGLGAALAAAAGALYGILYFFDPYMGAMPSIKAFAIIILGGLGSIPGAVVGGLLYGVAENFAVFFLGAPWRDAIAFAVLITALVLRPTGIFGERPG